MDLKEILPMKPSKIEIFHSVDSYDEKTGENLRNFNDVEKRINSKKTKSEFF